MYDDPQDPYNARHAEPPAPCKHGWGSNCECQQGWYSGLYVVPIGFSHDDKTRHIVARMKQAHDGGMREFIDPVSDETVGSCGVNFARKHVKALDEFAWDHNEFA